MERKVTVIPAKRILPGTRSKQAKPQQKVRVAAYCRVSTEQDEQENSFRNQVDYYTRYIGEHPEYELAGIYTDEGISGTNTKRREGFRRLIADCEDHKIDMVITKSISRFARNTQDCLENYRKLKSLGVTLVFEKENISSADTTGELLLTILSSLAQDESRNISENCKWGIRSKFQQGIPHINTYKFMGFDKDREGRLVVNEKEAVLVRRIFREFMEGYNTNQIAKHLNEEKIPGVSGKPKWLGATVEAMLRNEKYMGDSLMQKTYTADYLTKRQVKNNGEITQYYVKDSHPGIIPRSEWAAVQQEFERRKHYCMEHRIRQYGYSGERRPFSTRIVCGRCGAAYGRKTHTSRGVTYWQCVERCAHGTGACKGENISESLICRAFVEAWNMVVDQMEELRVKWESLEREGTELQDFRAQQMRAISEQGPIAEVVPELVVAVLECIKIMGNGVFEVSFLDGTTYQIKF